MTSETTYCIKQQFICNKDPIKSAYFFEVLSKKAQGYKVSRIKEITKIRVEINAGQKNNRKDEAVIFGKN